MRHPSQRHSSRKLNRGRQYSERAVFDVARGNFAMMDRDDDGGLPPQKKKHLQNGMNLQKEIQKLSKSMSLTTSICTIHHHPTA
jgi:hypothetical protein